MLSDKPVPDFEQTSHLKDYSEAQTTGVIRKRVTHSGSHGERVGEHIIFCLDVNTHVVQM